MPDGGRLTISVEKSEDEFVVKISDTGCDIEEKDLGRILDPLSVCISGKNQKGLEQLFRPRCNNAIIDPDGTEFANDFVH